MVSFGGRDHSELAVGCTDPKKLADGYRATIDRYHASTIDFDLEGDSLTAVAANARRAAAIETIQKEMAAHGTALRVWMTLPVSQAGLTPAGLAAVRAMLDAHVKLEGVNAMAMDFGPGQGGDRTMIKTVERSLDATRGQVQSLWRGAGLPTSTASAWGHVGATVMLGVNDAPGQQLTTADARALAAFVSRHGIPRVSVWSLNRDSECGGAFVRTGVVSNTCSGVLQNPLQFTRILGSLKGTKIARSQAGSGSTQQQTATDTPDDPATSPYPIWRSTAAYGTGYKVVWHREIYQATWWNQGTPPDAATAIRRAAMAADRPGPAGSRRRSWSRPAPGDFRPWSPNVVYHQGDRVSFEGLPYQARWYTQGEQPLNDLPSDPGVPWEPLFKFPGEPTGGSTGGVRMSVFCVPGQEHRPPPPVGCRHPPTRCRGPARSRGTGRWRSDAPRSCSPSRLGRARGHGHQRPGDRRRRRAREPHRDGRLPPRRQPARRIGDRLPLRHGSASTTGPKQGPAHAPGDARRVLRRAPPIADRADPLLPGGAARRS